MKNINNDIEFIDLISPIMNNNNFIETQNTIHHGIKKINHSMKIAYYSYRIAKVMNLDYKSVARAGLLHDFFLSNCNGKSLCRDSIALTYKHHNIALRNARRNFKLNDIERDIIVKHMFPIVPRIPKYKESLLVALVDKAVGTVEGLSKLTKFFNSKLLSKVIPGFILAVNILK